MFIDFTSVEKQGYFNIDGRKKDSADLDDFDSKINEVKIYFKTV